MPRGRPKTVVAPCRYCNKQFKRQEHVLRHERTHTHEKPFVCNCGQSFTRQDLLTRHARLSHTPGSDIPSSSVEVAQVTTCDTTDTSGGDLDLFWDSNFTTQELLSATLFDANLSFVNTPSEPQTSSLSQFSSRLPSLTDNDIDLDTGIQDKSIDDDHVSLPWAITNSAYENICLEVQSYLDVLPLRCSVPSRNNLSRYLEKYLRCVQEFLPFLNPATFSITQKDVELVLAIAALGALYTYEHTKAYELYFMAKSILVEKIRREDLELASNSLSGQDEVPPGGRSTLGRVQSFVLLISFASWANRNVLQDALFMGSKLAMLVRQAGIADSDEFPLNIKWLSWIAIEERRRTLFAAYVVLNMHSIAFGIPPLILYHEIGLFLPGCARSWKANDAMQWSGTNIQVESHFQKALRCLLDGTGISKDASVSSFSNYLLIHGLSQQIYIDRHGSMGLLGADNICRLEKSLHLWQQSWEQTGESTLDPLSAKGPFGLTATALLRLAYIRLNSDFRLCQGLISGDLRSITARHSNLSRSPQVDNGVLHAAHALSVPVRLGVTFMASTKSSIWTIEHSLCSLECALLLKEWLEMISMTVKSFGAEGLRNVERKLLGIVSGIIKETSFAETLDLFEDEASRIERMATTVIKLWTQIFQGIHLLEIDNVIRAGLQLLVDSSPIYPS